MGGFIKVKSDQFDAWTGGKPNRDLTGLENPEEAQEALTLTPNKFRTSSSTNATKLYETRRTGITPKFTLRDSLQEFLLKKFLSTSGTLGWAALRTFPT
jgi:hypothetical protein